MKFKVSFKTPDAIQDSLSMHADISDDEDAYNEALAFARKFVKYDEYLTVEFDTEVGTCTVLKVNELYD